VSSPDQNVTMNQAERLTTEELRELYPVSDKEFEKIINAGDVNPDKPIPSVERDEDSDRKALYVRLSRLPFYDNFASNHRGLRFPNPVDVRHRDTFERGVSADLSKDPFETRILMNGLRVSQVLPVTEKQNPPYFAPDANLKIEVLEKILNTTFPGVDLYPELRQPPGSNNFFGEHWGYLLLNLYDAEGLLAAGEEWRTDHVMAALRWQLLDFADIVYLHYQPLEHDMEVHTAWRFRKLTERQRFLVLPFHCPGHWAVVIFDKLRGKLGYIDTHPNEKGNDSNYAKVTKTALKLLKFALERKDMEGHEVIRVPVTRQKSATNCGWHVANYVTFFFRENRGVNDWEFSDWTKSNLLKTIPPGISHEEAAMRIWMFAIRSEINGTGQQIRWPFNCPCIQYEHYRTVKARYNDMLYISQQRCIKEKINTITQTEARFDRLPTPMITQSYVDRFGGIDLRRPIDHRTSRRKSETVPHTGELLTLEDTVAKVRALTVPFHIKPVTTFGGDGTNSVPPEGSDQKGKGKAVERPADFDNRGPSDGWGSAELHNAWCNKWISTRSAKVWVPMPTIAESHTSWEAKIGQARREMAGANAEEQAMARKNRAQNRSRGKAPDTDQP
jgi:hypothetical protein